MKRIISAILCTAVCLVGTVVSADNYVTAKYDYKEKTVEIIGSVGTEADVPVTVCIVDSSAPALSDDNPPDAAYPIFTGADGKINDKRTFEKVLPSGLCSVSLTSVSGSAETNFIVFDVENISTQQVLAKINAETDSKTLANYLATDRNIEKVGYLLSDTEEYLDSIAQFCIALKKTEKKDLDFTKLLQAIDYTLLIGKARNGAAMDECMSAYCGSLGCKYDEYTATTEEMKKEIEKLLKSADYLKNGELVSFEKIQLICRARLAAESWTELRDLLSGEQEDYGIDMGRNSVYASVPKSKCQQVFYNMLDKVKNAQSLTEISEAFIKECKAVKSQSDKGTASSASSGSGSGGVIAAASTVNNLNELPDYNEKKTDDNKADDSKKFSDIDSHFSKESVEYLTQKGILSGYEDNTFRPGGTVTRAEMAVMLCRILNEEKMDSTESESFFSDVRADDWFANAVNELAQKTIIVGNNGLFAPSDYVTRQDAAVLIKRVADSMGIKMGEEPKQFADSELISDYAQSAVAALSADGIIKGSDGYFRAQDTCTRGEMAVMLYRLLTKEEGAQ